MSRQAQNLLLGGVAAAVAVVALVAASLLLLGGDDGETTAAIDPLAGTAPLADADADGSGATQGGSVQAESGGAAEALSSPSSLPPRSTLAVALASTSTSTSQPTTSTTAATTTTKLVTTASTTTSTTGTTVESTSSTMPTSETTDTTDPSASSTTDPNASTSTTIGSSTTVETSSTTQPATTLPPVGGLNPLEQEIARLTNELRTNPNGPLKRQGPVPQCDLRVDRSTGQYEPLAPVIIHEVASLQVARPWSEQMTRNLQHRPQAGGPALRAVGIDARSYGENISFNNYPDKAMRHFTGWRESDGHFCNMMRPGWTHLGVGESTRQNGDSFATQNFFTL